MLYGEKLLNVLRLYQSVNFIELVVLGQEENFLEGSLRLFITIDKRCKNDVIPAVDK